MKPQQQDTEAKKESAVYVQTPDGKTIDVHAPEPKTEGNEADQQTAENTPTQSSSEVTSGEAG